MTLYSTKEDYTSNDEQLITLEDMCEQLMISETTAYKLLRSKKIAAFKIGCNWKIPKSSISKYIEQETMAAMQSPNMNF